MKLSISYRLLVLVHCFEPVDHVIYIHTLIGKSAISKSVKQAYQLPQLYIKPLSFFCSHIS